MNPILAICLIVAALVVGAVVGMVVRVGSDERKLGSAKEQAKRMATMARIIYKCILCCFAFLA